MFAPSHAPGQQRSQHALRDTVFAHEKVAISSTVPPAKGTPPGLFDVANRASTHALTRPMMYLDYVEGTTPGALSPPVQVRCGPRTKRLRAANEPEVW